MLIATATLRGEVIDRRRLCLEAHYSFLQYSDLLNLANAFFTFTSRLLSAGFYTQWAFRGRSCNLSTLEKVLSNEYWQSPALDFHAIANVQSCHVYDKASFRNFYKENMQLMTTGTWQVFADKYPSIFQKFLFQHAENDCKEALLQWFAQQGKIDYGMYYEDDAAAFFSGCYYHSDHNKYHGSLKLCFNATCLGSELSAYAEKLLCFAKEIATFHPTVNALITLTPMLLTSKCSPHMLYFGRLPKESVFYNGVQYSPNEWYPYVYLCGAEWANILSPRIVKRINLSKADLSAVSVESLSNGGAAVVLKKEIADTDVCDLSKVKQLLYPALLHGERIVKKKDFFNMKAFSFGTKPRLRWERIPIFENELIETESAIIYRLEDA